MQAKGKKVMVVVDPTRDSSGALQYALSHSVLDHDELILFHVENPGDWIHAMNIHTFLKIPTAAVQAISSDHGNGSGSGNRNGNGNRNRNGHGNNLGIDPVKDFLEEKKNECIKAKPNLNVRIERVAMEASSRDKANSILHHSEALGADVVIIGQRRSLLQKGHLGTKTWPGGRSAGYRSSSSKGINTAEYLIENCKCTCIAVQKKCLAGGFVINSKTHKNFWLLA